MAGETQGLRLLVRYQKMLAPDPFNHKADGLCKMGHVLSFRFIV